MPSFYEKPAIAILPLLFASSGCVLIDGVECHEDRDCSDGVFCNGEEVCQNGVCFVGDAPCGCDCIEELDACGECCHDADCDDGVFCNGTETCLDLTCFDGDPPCADSCCNEDDDECPECCEDADCDDGIFCNGAELCVEGTCAPGDPPCARGGLTCDGNCFEDTDECISPCVTDADCDDGQFCNGEEICDPCGFCQVSHAPCGQFGPPGCPGLCLEEGDVCSDRCTDDLDCNDELFCNGAETCDECGFCQNGAPPCGEDTECNEIAGLCSGN